MQFVTWKDLSRRSTLSVSTLKRLRKVDPTFPKKRQLADQRVGFEETEVNRWLESLGREELLAS